MLIQHSAFYLPALVLLLSLNAASAAPVSPDRPPAQEAAIQRASTRALAWINEHPATPEDGGLCDMIDEAVSWRVFQQLSRSVVRRHRYAHRFRRQVHKLAQSPEFQRWSDLPHKPLLDHYHLVLGAYLLKLAGEESPLTRSIADQARQALKTASFENPTVRLTTTLFLSRLDGQANIDIEPLLAGSLIAHLARHPQSIRFSESSAESARQRRTSWLLYALVHEVVALTDFGSRAPSPWLAERQDAVAGVLLNGVVWAIAADNLDLVAELVVTLYFLGEPLHAQVREALNTLLARQAPDGSWGASNTSARPNPVRHTVLTSSAALLAWQDWRTRR